MPSLYLDLPPDTPALRRRITAAFLRENWPIVPEPEVSALALVDSAKICDSMIDELRGRSAGVIALVWGPRDPIFDGTVLWRVDGVVDRDDAEDDWLRAAHEVSSGLGWISPQLVPRYRALFSESAIQARSEHDTWQRKLTEAEYDIVRLVVRGYSNAQIADERWVREATIKQQLTKVYRKLGIRGRSTLISLGYQKKRFP